MKNYILADLQRILKKKSFLLVFLIFIVSFFLLMFVISNSTFTGDQYANYTGIFINFFPIFAGIPLFISVYNDDFKSKSMQVAIGYGISRKKVILTKIFDIILLSFGIGIVFGALFLLNPVLLNVSLTGANISSVIISLFGSILLIIGYTSISSILLYFTENAVLGIVAFILLASGTVSMVLGLILGQNFIANTFGNIVSYLFTNSISAQMHNVLTLGHPTFSLIPTLIVYIILPVGISMLLFEKKELEF